ncbi:MAG TPA: hypothetical protein DCF73_10995 [Rhodobiaceae bacterium]|nr:hypothetical protein [Rhodobiaceae bacterium]
MSRHKFTHEGVIMGADARARGKRFKVKLRQTANYWVDHHGRKYSRRGFEGNGVGDWPLWMLDMDTVRPTPHGEGNE